MLRKTNIFCFASFLLIFLLMPSKAYSQALDDLNLGDSLEEEKKSDEKDAGEAKNDVDAETEAKVNPAEKAKKPEKPATSLAPEIISNAEKNKNDALVAYGKKIYDNALILAQEALKENPSLENELRPIISECEKEIANYNPQQTSKSEESQRGESLGRIEKKSADPIISGKILADAIAEANNNKYVDAINLIARAKKEFDDSISDISGYPAKLLKDKVDKATKDAILKLSMHIKDQALAEYSKIKTKPGEKEIPDLFYNTAKQKYEAVISTLQKAMTDAMKTNPSSAKSMQTLVDDCEENMKSLEFKKITNIDHTDPDNPNFNMDPERPQRNYEKDVSLKQAQVLVDNEEYILARNALEKILARDPYNLKAVQLLGNLYQKFFQIAKIRKYNNDLERLTETRWKWNEAVLQSPVIKPELDQTVSESANSELYKKLNDIVIDKMQFENTPIIPVINWVIMRSRDLDPLGEGVNIMVQTNPNNVNSIPSITMEFDIIPVGELIRYICLNCGLKYRVEQHVVIISDELTDLMETRFFKVRANLIASIIPKVEEEKENDMMTDKEFINTDDTLLKARGDDSNRKRNVTTDALIAYFAERGIPSPEGATIAYTSNRLTATNTPENLRRLETLLREMDIEIPLILVESKFIEITQNDIEDLSFEWIFSKNSGQANPTDNDSWWQVLPNASTVRPLGTNWSGVLSPVNSSINDRILNNVVFPAFGGRDRMHLKMMLHALDQSTKTEVLSAPKVIAMSGAESVIRLGRVEYYPSSWTDPSVAVTNGTYSINPPEPDLGEATNTGIILTVTPTVNSNKYTIDLVMNPQVVDQSGWTDFYYNLVIGNQGASNLFNLKMPEISRRDLTTSVKVYDGETIVLGGMIREDISSVNDTIPGLGQIPIFGRLATAQNQSATKRNLLIFVTARLINPDGVPIRELEGNGIPDFKR